MNEMLEKARKIQDQIIADRRSLHQIPEVGVYTPPPREPPPTRAATPPTPPCCGARPAS